jgi:hypothetical protein
LTDEGTVHVGTMDPDTPHDVLSYWADAGEAHTSARTAKTMRRFMDKPLLGLDASVRMVLARPGREGGTIIAL